MKGRREQRSDVVGFRPGAQTRSKSATAATALSAGGIGWCRGDVLSGDTERKPRISKLRPCIFSLQLPALSLSAPLSPTHLNSADSHASSGEGTESRLGARAWGLCAGTAGRAELDVEGGDADLLAAGGDVLGGQHGGVWRGLVPVGLDLHAAGDARDGFLAVDGGDVDEGVVERGEDVGDAEDELGVGRAWWIVRRRVVYEKVVGGYGEGEVDWLPRSAFSSRFQRHLLQARRSK